MINDAALDATPGLQPVNGQRAWTRSMTPADDLRTATMLAQMTAWMGAFGDSIANYATDRVALLPLPDGGHPGGQGTLGPFVCIQKLAKGPASQVKPYDSSVPNAAYISAVDAASPYTWSQEPDQSL